MGADLKISARKRAEKIWAAYAKAQALRSTNQRTLICDIFLESTGHYTVDDLLAKVRARDPKVGYATVYRTLKHLVDANIARESNFGDTVTRYEFALDDQHHDHIICLDCHAILEFENEEIEILQDRIAEGLHFRLEDHRLELFGRCELAKTKKGCPRAKDKPGMPS